MSKVCVDCQQEVAGKRAVKIREDRVIRLIRWGKRLLKISKENELYVCTDCMSKHEQRRKSFEKTMLVFAVIAALIIVLMVFTIILSGRLEMWAIASGVLIIVLLALFSIIFKYVPATETMEPVMVPAEKPEPVKKKAAKPKRKGGK